jgi:hypothetical protein
VTERTKLSNSALSVRPDVRSGNVRSSRCSEFPELLFECNDESRVEEDSDARVSSKPGAVAYGSGYSSSKASSSFDLNSPSTKSSSSNLRRSLSFLLMTDEIIPSILQA